MNLLITGAWQFACEHEDKLKLLGHSVVFMQHESKELPCEYDWVEGIVGNGIFLSHPIEKFTNLRYIQLTSVGYDRVPMDYIETHKIEIHNARGVYSIPMAEFAISGVLQIYKHSKYFYEKQKEHCWEKHRGLLELNGKTVCIVGCGSVGTECAKRFSAFGCRIIGIDLYPRNDEIYDEMITLDELDKVLHNTDILIMTLPLTDATRHLIDDKRIEHLKDNAVIVNIARGAIVDTDALLANIDRLGGAVLDVFEDEPLDNNSPLWDKENVIVTPHNSFVGEGNQERLVSVIINNLEGL